MDILDVARRNQQKAWEIIEKVNVIPIWESIGAQVNLVGSLRMGLLMKHRDIDFHIYTSSLSLADSFRAMAKLAENTSVKKIECVNLLHTVEACVEWHAWYQDSDNALWQIDMIHIRKGSRYDGYFEKVAERISARRQEFQDCSLFRLFLLFLSLPRFPRQIPPQAGSRLPRPPKRKNTLREYRI